MKHSQGINGKLISFSIPNGALAAKDFPDRLKLLNWGPNKLNDGQIVRVGKETLKQLAANQAKLGFDAVALDYNHQTVPESEEYEKIIKQRGSIDPIAVAAYGIPEVVENEGLFLNISEWTPSGRENAANYRDLSPTPLLDKNGEVVFLHSAALCRQGKVEGLTFYSASILNPSSLKPHTASNSMDYRLALLAILKGCKVDLPDNPSDAEINDAVQKFAVPDAGTGAGGMSMAQVEAAIAKAINPLSAQFEDGKREALVVQATAAGKVIPLTADQIKTIPLTTLAAMVDKLPVTVSLAARGAAIEEKRKVTTLSVDQKKICQALGVAEDKFLAKLSEEVHVHTPAV